jgi:hypothetical protein
MRFAGTSAGIFYLVADVITLTSFVTSANPTCSVIEETLKVFLGL